MSAERLAEENARLVRRERLDLVPTKVLGLFVVGSLARHLDLRVTLSRTPGGGVTSTVLIPAALLLAMSPVDAAPPAAGRGRTTRELTPHTAAPPSAATATATAITATAPERRPVAPSPEGELPRRVPLRPRTAGAEAPDTASPPTTARPLRRRVRGATLTSTAAARTVPAVRQPADAEAVRAELDEFEAAVRRAERDSAEPDSAARGGAAQDSAAHLGAEPPNPARTTATRENPRRPEGDGQ
jgi:hypothetical protein